MLRARLCPESGLHAQRDNTLVLFHSDHGEMPGDHGIYLKGPYCYDMAWTVDPLPARRSPW